MCFSQPQDNSAQLAQQKEAQRQQQITQGQNAIDQNFSKFNDDFYNSIAQSYRDYAMPQYDRQAMQANADLTYGLARAGLINSTAGAKQMGDLAYDQGLAKQSIEDQAQNAANNQRTQVQNARSALVSDLQASGDAGAAASGAGARAAMLSMMPTYSPIGTLFQNVTGGLSAAGQGNGLFSTSTGNVGAVGPGGVNYANSGPSSYVVR